MGNICERSSMNKSGSTFGSLHQVGIDGIFQQNSNGTGYS